MRKASNHNTSDKFKKIILKNLLRRESKMASKSSMEVLKELEKLDDELLTTNAEEGLKDEM